MPNQATGKGRVGAETITFFVLEREVPVAGCSDSSSHVFAQRDQYSAFFRNPIKARAVKHAGRFHTDIDSATVATALALSVVMRVSPGRGSSPQFSNRGQGWEKLVRECEKIVYVCGKLEPL